MSFLRFDRLSIRRMPGIADAFELRDLAAGLNIVFGPNASGKTTTARSIEGLLWPGVAPDSAWLEATFDFDGARWWMEIDGTRVRHQRDGQDAEAPHPLAEEVRYRYHLPLHTLLDAEDTGFARAIALESAGGYDLVSAARVLEPKRPGGFSRPRAQQERLRKAQEELQRARLAQEGLQIEAASLREDEARLATRPRTEQRLRLLSTALELAERTREANSAAQELASFPPAVERLSGDEGSRHESQRERIRKATEALGAAERELEAARSTMAGLGLDAEAVEGGGIRVAAADVAEVERVAAELRASRAALEQIRQQVRNEAARLGIEGPEGLKTFTPERLGALTAAAGALGEARAARTALQAELDVLGEPDAPADKATLERGSYLLEQWLRVPDDAGVDGAAGLRRVAIGTALVIIAAGIALGVLLHPAAAALALLGVGLLFVAVRRPKVTDPRSEIQREYVELGLDPAPEAWDREAVAEAASLIGSRVAAARLQDEIRARRGPLEQRLEDARGREGQAMEKLRPVAESFGIGDAATQSVGLLLERVGKLLDLDAQLRRFGADVERQTAALEEAMQRANERLGAFDLPPAETPAALRAAIEGLEIRRDRWVETRARIEKAEAAVRHYTDVIQAARESLSQLASHLGVDELDARQLAEWLGMRERVLRTRRRYDGLDEERKRLERTLRETDGFTPELLSPDTAALQAEILRLEETLEGLDVLRDKVVELRHRVRSAKQSHQVEEALDELDRATLALREVRDGDAAGFVATELVRWVDEQSRNQHRPEVFHRASRLFTTITHGRYELRLDEEGAPAFRAWDAERERSQPLEELSSATRIQLLLAVRIAFVEVQEKGVGLPLLLDETLANSDPERSGAIIDAMLTLAEQGRQIFYFTAQPDEVRRWRVAIQGRGEGVDHRVIDLAQVRRSERSLDDAALERVTAAPLAFPSPNGDGHVQYGKRLRVPSVDVQEPIGSLHLWYLVENPETLYRILDTLAVETWGSFRTLLEAGGSDMLDSASVGRIRVLGAAAESALERLGVGRGRLVDRRALEASGAVSDAFIDEVSTLAESVAGDGAALIAAIEDRAVAGFYRAKANALREYLEAQGYIDPRTTIRPERIRLEVLRDMEGEIATGVVDRAEIERLLVRLGVVVVREIEPVQADLGLF